MTAARSIKTRIIPIVLALMAVIFGLSGSFMYWNSYKMAMKESREKASAIARIIGGIGSYTFLTGDYTILDEAVQKAMEQEEILYIRIYDKAGNIQRDNSKGDIHSQHIEVKEPVLVAEEPAGHVLFGLSTRETLASLKKGIGITILQILAGMLISSALLIAVLNKLIISRIRLLGSAAAIISEGNLMHKVTVSGTDEISSLGSAINGMASSLKDMIFRIRGISNIMTSATASLSASSHKVLDSAQVQKTAILETSGAVAEMNRAITTVAASEDSLAQLAAETSSSIMEMNASTSQIAENARMFSEASHETASSIEEMIASIKQIAGSLEQLSVFSEEISSAISQLSSSVQEVKDSSGRSVALAEQVSRDVTEEGISAVHAAMKGIDEIRAAVNGLSSVINRLRVRSEDIGKILTVIDTVADQTTLLAINAAILASKAGEHGRGFSVVANEIKDLAERTTISTTEISKLIQSVQDETKSSVEMTSQGLAAVEKGTLLFDNVGAALNRILESASTSTEMSKMIQRATDQEAQVINQITHSIRSLVDQISRIASATAEQKKGSTFIIDATEKMKNVSLQVKTSTKELSAGSGQINSAIETQNSRIGEIRESTSSQKIRSAEIVRAIDSITATTEELIRSSSSLDSEINTLTLEAQNLLSALEKFRT